MVNAKETINAINDFQEGGGDRFLGIFIFCEKTRLSLTFAFTFFLT
jgi:hypothetical protein